MGGSAKDLDAKFRLLSAETRAWALRLRQLEASSRRLKDEASDLICCLHEVRSLQGLTAPPGARAGSQRLH